MSILSKIGDISGDAGGVGWIVETILKLFSRKGPTTPTAAGTGTSQSDPLKAHAFGIGPNDNALYADAIALAFASETNNDVAQEKIERLLQVYDELNYFQKKSLIRIIGIEEQDEVETTPVTVTFTDNKGVERQKIEKKEKKYTANVRGKRLIQFLGRLDVNEAVDFLQNSGILTGPLDDIEEFWKVVEPKLVAWWNALATQKNIDGVKAWATDTKQHTQDAILWYLGAVDLADAIRIVAARKQEVARLRALPFYDRNLKGGKVFTTTALTLVGIIVLSIVIVVAKS